MTNLIFPSDWPKEIVEIIQSVGIATQKEIDSVTLQQLQDTWTIRESIKVVFSNIIPLLENYDKAINNKKFKDVLQWFTEVIFMKKNDIAIGILGIVKISELLKVIQLLIPIIEKQQETVKSLGNQALVKCSLNVQKQFFGKKQEDIVKALDKVRYRIGLSENTLLTVEQFGLNLGVSEQNALFAIQAMLSLRGYEVDNGNDSTDNTSKRRLIFTIAEYLTAFGVTKKLTKRGWNEFSQQERENAIWSLRDLAKLQAFILYQVPTGKKDKEGNELFDTYGGYDNIIKILAYYGNLPKDSAQKAVATNAIRSVLVELHPILFVEIDNYFCLKHANYRQEIKQLLGKKNEKTINLFIEKLFEQASLKLRSNQELIFDITVENLAIQLRMEKAIKQRKWKRINETIDKCVDIATKLGYLLKAEKVFDQRQRPKLSFELNPERFYKKQEENKEN